MVKFIGFSSYNHRIGSTTLEDIDLAKRDLFNHFHTRRGERLGEPEFGTIIPELLFEPFDLRVTDLIDEDIRTIVNTDPRWTMVDYDIDDSRQHSVTVNLRLRYEPDQSVQVLILTYRAEEEI